MTGARERQSAMAPAPTYALATALLLFAACGPSRAHTRPDGAIAAEDTDAGATRTVPRLARAASDTAPGVVLPYSLDRVLSTFGDCRDGGRRQHRGLDIGGVGDNQGLGTPVRSMVRARITMIGTGEQDPDRFGRPDTRSGTTERARQDLPRSFVVPGYGRVYFFTRDYGSWRSGTIIVTEALEGPMAGYRIRYMHLGGIHPGLQVGDEVEAGQELGLMGGTAIQSDSPHVHIDIEDLNAQRVDVAPLLGLPADTRRCTTAR